MKATAGHTFILKLPQLGYRTWEVLGLGAAWERLEALDDLVLHSAGLSLSLRRLLAIALRRPSLVNPSSW